MFISWLISELSRIWSIGKGLWDNMSKYPIRRFLEVLACIFPPQLPFGLPKSHSGLLCK